MALLKTKTVHIRFDRKVKWKDLAPVFPEMLKRFLNETGQMPTDGEVFDILVAQNLRDLKANRKPEGFNREGATTRMVFPRTNHVEFYVYGRGKPPELARVADVLSAWLQRKKLKHAVDWDRTTVFREET